MDITNLDLSEFLEADEQEAKNKELAKLAEEFLKSCGKENIEIYRIEKFKPTL